MGAARNPGPLFVPCKARPFCALHSKSRRPSGPSDQLLGAEQCPALCELWALLLLILLSGSLPGFGRLPHTRAFGRTLLTAPGEPAADLPASLCSSLLAMFCVSRQTLSSVSSGWAPQGSLPCTTARTPSNHKAAAPGDLTSLFLVPRGPMSFLAGC